MPDLRPASPVAVAPSPSPTLLVAAVESTYDPYSVTTDTDIQSYATYIAPSSSYILYTSAGGTYTVTRLYSVSTSTGDLTPASASVHSSASSAATAHQTVADSTDATYAPAAAAETSPTSQPSSKPLTIPALVGISIGSTLLVVALISSLCWCRRRRARRSMTTMEKPRRRHPDEGLGARSLLTTRDAFDVVALPPPRHVLPPSETSVSPPPSFTSGSRHSDNRSSAAWTDNTEFDAVATDGSSIARTLSNVSSTSTARPGDTDASGANPFDHPAYTYRPLRSAHTHTNTNTNTHSNSNSDTYISSSSRALTRIDPTSSTLTWMTSPVATSPLENPFAVSPISPPPSAVLPTTYDSMRQSLLGRPLSVSSFETMGTPPPTYTDLYPSFSRTSR